MATLALVNPRRRRKMSALQKKYFGAHKKRRKSASARAANPRRRRRTHARRHNVYLNPRRRSRRSITRNANPSRRARHANPNLRNVTASVMPTLRAGMIGATGALGLDLLWGYTSQYLPASIAGSPIAQYAAKLAGAILVGIAGNMVMKGKGRDLAVGATTVVLHDALKAQVQSSFPSIKLGEYLTYAPTVGGAMGRPRILSTGMGEYLNGLGSAGGDSISNREINDGYQIDANSGVDYLDDSAGNYNY